MQGMTISEKVINCAFEVSNKLGAGFLESVYENALCLELTHQGIEFEQQKAQLMNYLRATDLSVGLLLNFATPRLGIRRIVWQYNETERI